MKQYKLLKDLPGVKAGEIFSKPVNSDEYFPECGGYGYPESFLKVHSDFFQEVKELEKLFTIRDMEDAYYASTIHSNFRAYIGYSFPQHVDQLKHLK